MIMGVAERRTTDGPAATLPGFVPGSHAGRPRPADRHAGRASAPNHARSPREGRSNAHLRRHRLTTHAPGRPHQHATARGQPVRSRLAPGHRRGGRRRHRLRGRDRPATDDVLPALAGLQRHRGRQRRGARPPGPPGCRAVRRTLPSRLGSLGPRRTQAPRPQRRDPARAGARRTRRRGRLLDARRPARQRNRHRDPDRRSARDPRPQPGTAAGRTPRSNASRGSGHERQRAEHRLRRAPGADAPTAAGRTRQRPQHARRPPGATPESSS